MNVAILIPELWGGGAQRVAQVLGNYYVDQGNKVFYFLQDTNAKQDYRVKGKIVRTSIQSCMVGTNDVWRMLRLVRASCQMRKLKRQYKIDVAISFMEESNYINILSKGREKVITSIHSMLSIYEKMYAENWLYKKSVISFFYPKSDILVVLSKISFEEMKTYYGVPKRKMRVIPNMIMNDLLTKSEQEQWIYGVKVVVCMGRLHPVKQQERIIRAFSYTCKKEPDVILIILGKGEQLRYLKKVSESCHIQDKVIFMGFTDDISFYLRNARVFVMASKVECFPNSILEAMLFGLPIITTDSPGGCREIIGKTESANKADSIMFCQYGILTPAMPDEKLLDDQPLIKQEIELGEAMLKVLTDDKIYEKYRERSLKRAQMYSLDRVIRKWNCLISRKGES